MNIHISANFKKMALRAIFSIALFVLTYIVLIGLSVSLTIALGYAGIMLIAFKPMFLTIMLGLGLMSVGVFILIFLFKFITKKHTVDRSHLIEIKAADEPELFQIIRDVVNEVHTKFPRKVYLSYEINAAVFYNSTFWSMFFPVRKNLQIGVGLINSVTTSELKAILAHEFGHFSQRSMKVGSYVYNVNQVIYNLLYDNESYNALLGSWAGASKYFHVFAEGAVKIITGIQWILRKVYNIVNLSYMALSREMEFHADEVAANVTGPQPIIASLLRLEMADQSFNTVLNYYSQLIENCIKAKNIYTQHGWVMNFIGSENNITIESGLVQVTKEDLSRFNKSKLTIKDQWSSHPTTKERIDYLLSLNVADKDKDNTLASTLFKNKEAIQEEFTERLFKPIEYKNPPVVSADEQFIEEYKTNFIKGSFDKIYNGYYDTKYTGIEEPRPEENEIEITTNSLTLFNNEAVDMVYTADAMESDIQTLKNITTGESSIKTFDYDGQRYTKQDCDDLIPSLEESLVAIKKQIEIHDNEICKYFFILAKQNGKDIHLHEKYTSFLSVYNAYERRAALFIKMRNGTAFLQQTTPYDTIEHNLLTLEETEQELKIEIKNLLTDPEHLLMITPEISESFNSYIENKKSYFTRPDYDDAALEIMYKAVNNYQTLISDTLFDVKKSLLSYQADLVRLYG